MYEYDTHAFSANKFQLREDGGDLGSLAAYQELVKELGGTVDKFTGYAAMGEAGLKALRAELIAVAAAAKKKEIEARYSDIKSNSTTHMQ